MVVHIYNIIFNETSSSKFLYLWQTQDSEARAFWTKQDLEQQYKFCWNSTWVMNDISRGIVLLSHM